MTGRTGARAEVPWAALCVVAVLALLPVGRLSELPLAIGAVAGLVLLARGRLGEVRSGAVLALALFAAYWLAALLSAGAAVRPDKTLSTIASLLRFAPFALFAVHALRRPADLERATLAIAAIVSLWVIDAWVQMLTGYGLAGAAEAERITGIFGADNVKFGPVLATLSPFVLIVARERYGRRGLAVAALAVLVPVLLAGSRSAWIAYALVCAVLAWRETRRWSTFAALATAVAAIAAIAVALAWQVSDRFDARIDRSLRAFEGTGQAIDEASAGRLAIWHAAVSMSAAHPLTGVGVRGFRYAYPQYAVPGDRFVDTDGDTGASHAHQIVLEVLSETGMVGLALWLAGTVIAVRAWRRADAAARARARPAALALLAATFPLNSHLAFYSAWWSLLFWWLLALYAAAVTMPAPTASPSRPLSPPP